MHGAPYPSSRRTSRSSILRLPQIAKEYPTIQIAPLAQFGHRGHKDMFPMQVS